MYTITHSFIRIHSLGFCFLENFLEKRNVFKSNAIENVNVENIPNLIGKDIEQIKTEKDVTKRLNNLKKKVGRKEHFAKEKITSFQFDTRDVARFFIKN